MSAFWAKRACGCAPEWPSRSQMTQPVIARIEIPQRSSLLPLRGVLSFRSVTQEALAAPGSLPTKG